MDEDILLVLSSNDEINSCHLVGCSNDEINSCKRNKRQRVFVDVPSQRCGEIPTITESLWMASCIQDSGGS